MAEDKAFDPTPNRLQRAKREGDVARSQDLGAVASLAGAALALFAVLGPLAAATAGAVRAAAHPGDLSFGPFLAIATCALAVPVCGTAFSLVATYAQTRTFTFKAPSLKFQKLNPAEGFKRLFSRDAAIAGAKAAVVAAAVTIAVAPALRDAFAAGLSGGEPVRLAALVAHALPAIVGGAVGVAALFAAGDVLLERAKWKRRLKMSFDEIKRDYKQSEGDPLLRGRRRQAHRALVRGSIARVREAAFVVTNPTHVAIALAYRPPEIAVPRVLVRAIDAGALEVRRLAREARVPVVENVALARALLASTDVGDSIPADAYGAVAAIVAALVREGAIAS